jgi:hypothetical protein
MYGNTCKSLVECCAGLQPPRANMCVNHEQLKSKHTKTEAIAEMTVCAHQGCGIVHKSGRHGMQALCAWIMNDACKTCPWHLVKADDSRHAHTITTHTDALVESPHTFALWNVAHDPAFCSVTVYGPQHVASITQTHTGAIMLQRIRCPADCLQNVSVLALQHGRSGVMGGRGARVRRAGTQRWVCMYACMHVCLFVCMHIWNGVRRKYSNNIIACACICVCIHLNVCIYM